jgi:hypothetical protein
LSPIFTLSFSSLFSSLKLPQWLTLCVALLGPSIRRYALESSDHLFLLKAQTISKAQTMHSSLSFLQYNTASLIRDSTTHRLERLNDAVESSRQALALFSNSMSFALFHDILHVHVGQSVVMALIEHVFLACTLWA